MQALDDEMQVILERPDLSDGDKVVMYTQVLQRYNALANKRVKEPVHVVAVNDNGGPAATAAAAAKGAPTPPEAAAGSMEEEVIDSVPNILRPKSQTSDGASQRRYRVDRARRARPRGSAGARK
ncbi:MAG: hypothetical protein M3H12_18030 [Chromatiales bacterium]